MNLAERLNEKSVVVKSAKESVINEIVDYFKEWFESGKAEAYLEWRVNKEDLDKREMNIVLEFWEYSSGCSNTHFKIGGKEWNNGEVGCASNKYKDIVLCDIQKTTGAKLLNLAVYHFKNMGFNVQVEDRETWLGYYKKLIILSW